MKNLLSWLGTFIGLYFAADNYVVPVMRWGLYHRVVGSGFFWIIPFLEHTLPPVKTSLYVGNFTFVDVPSKDNILFTIRMTVLFSFQPTSAHPDAAAVLVKGGSDLLSSIVNDYASDGLRRLTAQFKAEELSGKPAILSIKRNLASLLRLQLAPLGIIPLRQDGLLIKEVIAPEKFKRAMVEARRIEAIVRAIAQYPTPHLVEQALRAEFISDVDQIDNLTLLSGTHPPETLALPYLPQLQQLPKPNGRSGQNGH